MTLDEGDEHNRRTAMNFQTIELNVLEIIVGGQAANAGAAAAPLGSAPGAGSEDDRLRRIAREEIDLEEKFREKEELRAFEKRHPFQAMLCSGDPDCLRRGMR
jgi:hypothetical protein